MLSTVVIRELRHNFLSLRFSLALLITVLVFGFGTVAFMKKYSARMDQYTKYQNELERAAQQTAGSNFTQLAVKKQDFIMKPRKDSFISSSWENHIPNSIQFSAYNVFGFESRAGSSNPYLNLTQELEWSFIVSIILSFTMLMLSFDSISGEKEAHTLALSLTNSVSRGTLLMGKFLATVMTSMVMLVAGICLSLIMLLVSGTFDVSLSIMGEVLGFIFFSGVFLASIAACGLFSSVIVKNSDLSLLIALVLWVLFVVIVPNSAIFWSQNIFPIDTSDAVNEKVQSARDALEKSGREGRWQMIFEQPFYPFHEVRADHQTNLMNSEMQLRNAYYHDMFRQLERARLLTLISPVSQYQYLCEAVVGGGFLRFQSVWNGLHVYQAQFLAFFKEKDAQDTGSPHWYNPYEDVSTTRKPVNFGEIPVFNEKPVSFGERFTFARTYFVVIVLYTAVVFFLTFALFVKYDVR
ncbi:ABC transporter permease [bacterium]|nr:ABC transporter permease [bacterium]